MKAKTATIAAALLIALAAPGAALAAQYQNISIEVAPQKLPVKKRVSASLTIHSQTGDPSVPVPSPPTRALLNLDNDLAVNFSAAGLGACDPVLLNSLTTQMAIDACPKAMVGSGSATARFPWPQSPFYLEAPVELTAFNGTKDSSGRHRLVLFARSDTFAIGTALVGTFRKSSAGSDYSVLLDVDVPLFADGQAALVDFRITVGGSYKKGFVLGRCHDSNRRINIKSRFYYLSGSSLAASDYAVCKRR